MLFFSYCVTEHKNYFHLFLPPASAHTRAGLSLTFKPLLDTERAVGLRVGDGRRYARLSQTTLAQATGMTRDQIANIEAGRVMLRFLAGWKVCEHLNVNQLWLATGRFPQKPFCRVSIANIITRIPESARFTQVCLGVLLFDDLKAATTAAAKDTVDYIDSSLPPAPCPPAGYLEKSCAAVKGALRHYNEQELKNWIINELNNDAPLRYQVEMVFTALEVLREQIAAEEKSKLRVDTFTPPAIIRPMSSETGYWKALVRRLVKLTSRTGAKAELAREMEVTRQAVNKWLSGKGAPSAELTLRVLNWVGRAEVKQKQSPVSVVAPPGQKTQVHSPKVYEKQTQVRKKR